MGEDVTLPGGLRVKVTVEAVRGRPWAAIERGWRWHVCHRPGRQRQPLVSFYFEPARRIPLSLSEADAKALADLLNRVALSSELRFSPSRPNVESATNSGANPLSVGKRVSAV